MTRGLPSIRPRTNCGKVFWLTSAVSTSTNASVAPLSASGSAPRIGSMAPGPMSFSRAMAFCRAGLVASVAERISVTSRSARRFVKKLMQPIYWTQLPARIHQRSPPGGERAHATRVFPVPAPLSQPTCEAGSAQPPDG